MFASMTGSPDAASSQALADEVRELSARCEQHVRDAIGISLDGSIETLPILDHYVRSAIEGSAQRPEVLPLLARTVGAYFGQVVADHFGAFWWLPSGDVYTWHVCFRSVLLAFNPIGMAHAALTWSQGADQLASGPPAELRLGSQYRELLEQRLGALPPVRESDFFSLSTRLEGLEVAAAALREAMIGHGVSGQIYDDDDYAELLADLHGPVLH